MSSTTLSVADLLERLGGIPPHRVRLRPAPGTATEQDVIAIEAREDRLFELIDGVLVEKGMGYYEGCLAYLLGHYLEDYLEVNDLGIGSGADGMMRLWAGRVRIPDVSFVSWDRLPGRAVPREPIPDLVPDLAVEVLSESNTAREMEIKLRDYFSAGVRLVWFVAPEPRTIRVFTAPDRSVTLGEADTLDGGDVLPGFALRVGDLFARADRRRGDHA